MARFTPCHTAIVSVCGICCVTQSLHGGTSDGRKGFSFLAWEKSDHAEKRLAVFKKLEGWWKRFVEAKQDGGARLVIVDVGPKDSITEIQHVMTKLEGLVPQFLFVDPNPSVFPGLLETLRRLGFGSKQYQMLNAAVCPEDGENASFYVFRDELLTDFPRLKREYVDRSYSMRKRYLAQSFLATESARLESGYSTEEWASMLSYIISKPVRCLSPATLLEEGRVTAADVDFLFVDAEGYDVELVKLFMAIPGFDPALILFEYGLTADYVDYQGNNIWMQRMAPLLETLKGRGYRVENVDLKWLAFGRAHL